jgi:hypothetical protein
MDPAFSQMKPSLKQPNSPLKQNPALANVKVDNYRNSFIMNFGLKSGAN